tara:strand:- start:5722 stop:6846 length:1125 start_codon:yes stop_codon:yes gene_type:complete
MDQATDFSTITDLFDMRADFVHAYPYGSGHINDTFCAEYDQAGHRLRYIHQRINSRVFQKPVELMDNIQRVTAHNQALLKERANPESLRRSLTLVPAKTGESYAVDADGEYWRTYLFIERARTYDKIESVAQARSAASAFGDFQRLASTLGGARLHETIPHFHDTPKRFDALNRAIERDPLNRASEAKEEIEFYESQYSRLSYIVDQLDSGAISERVTHNDTKLNNVMIDDFSGEGICVIDLDTVMPGCALYDFSDMVRTATNSAAEDEPDARKVHMLLPMMEAILSGYLSTAGRFLNENEKASLAPGASLLTLECGIRFLTDFLEGDTYFKIHRQGHNLDRCRTQVALAQSIHRQEKEIESMVREACGRIGES